MTGGPAGREAPPAPEGRPRALREHPAPAFTVAGAAGPELADTGVSHLVPMAFERLTRDAAPRIFGDDHPTPDGTCVRDYIHVVDLTEAHVAAAHALRASSGQDLTLNIGRGEGVSVREMIDRVNAVTGYDRPPTVTPRRPGDPTRVVASAERAAAELGWRAGLDVQDMIVSAREGWVRLHPEAARA